MSASGRPKGTGKHQKAAFELLISSNKRYTIAAIRLAIKAPQGTIEESITGLVEIGALKCDRWGNGWCYRMPHVSADENVIDVKMVRVLTVLDSRGNRLD